MKRIIYILFLFTVLTCFFGSTIALAADTAEDAETVEANEESATEIEAEVNIFTRLYEAFRDNSTNIFTLGGSTILFVLGMIFKKSFGASSAEINKGINKVLGKAADTETVQKTIASGFNEMVDGYNKLLESHENIEKRVQKFAEQMEAVIASTEGMKTEFSEGFMVMLSLTDKQILQNSAVMEVLSSISANNKVLPQGIKDFVALKRTECAKLAVEADALIHKDEAETTND